MFVFLLQLTTFIKVLIKLGILIFDNSDKFSPSMYSYIIYL